MTTPLAFVLLLLLVPPALELILCAERTLQSTTTTTTDSQGRIRANLIPRDDYFGDAKDASTPREKAARNARRSLLRVRYLESKTQLLRTTMSPSLASGNEDWKTDLSDGADAEYLMEIELGTPAQKFVTIADTGSDLTWLKCAPCQSGCESGITFQPTQSSTYGTLGCSSPMCRFLNETGSGCPLSNDTTTSSNTISSCPYMYLYGDGSVTRGTLAQETITLQTVAGGNKTVPDFWFGCSNNAASNSSLLDNTDGLVGLGRGNISFPTQLGNYFGYKFGYCLVSRLLPVVESTPLFFGKDAVPSDTTLQYTPLLSNTRISTFYYVNCTGISLQGELINTIPESAFAISSDGTGGFIFDSGTTYTTLAEPIYDPLLAALRAQIPSKYPEIQGSDGFNLCYLVSSWKDWANDYGDGVPTISFQLTNTTGFTLAAENAWFQAPVSGVDPGADQAVCLAILGITGNFSIFGNVQQVNFHILYDLENQQIGFVPVKCTSSNLASSASQEAGFSIGTTLLLAVVAIVLTLTQ